MRPVRAIRFPSRVRPSTCSARPTRISKERSATRTVSSSNSPTASRAYLNFESGNEVPADTAPIDIDTPEGTLQLISEDELEFRSEPYNRSKQKLEHILRMIDKIKLAGHSEDTKRTVYEHQRILEENISRFLGVDRRPSETDYDDD
jgi:hypothetical protein